PVPVLTLDESDTRAGAFAPEDWAGPKALYAAVEQVGTPRAEIVEAVVQRAILCRIGLPPAMTEERSP
ncbi:hypothetical protein ACFWWS_36840, partial [Streptomyces sp. NPDC059083]